MIKKIKALQLLRDLQIKVYIDKDRDGMSYTKVHYKDVLRALLMRVLEKNNVDYKLKGKQEKITEKWWVDKHTELKRHEESKTAITVA